MDNLENHENHENHDNLKDIDDLLKNYAFNLTTKIYSDYNTLQEIILEKSKSREMLCFSAYTDSIKRTIRQLEKVEEQSIKLNRTIIHGEYKELIQGEK